MQQIKIVEPYRLAIQGQVRLELPAETLFHLLNNGQVSAKNFRCLDSDSKRCVWRLLLESLRITAPEC